MAILIAGILLFAVIHLLPTVAPTFRQSLIGRIGENPYKGLAALLIIVSVVLMALGWRSTPEETLYVSPDGARILSFVIICIGFLLIGAAYHQTVIKRFIRHPMLTGVFLWAVAHLLVNGSVRAWVLFGGIAVWAIVEIILINRRDGAYEKPPRPGFSEELRGTFISAGVLLLLLVTHPFFAGVTPFPR